MTPQILRAMADTFEERRKVYGDNFKRVPEVMKILFPEGVPQELLTTTQWYLFELLILKISRFASGNLTHIDSVHDAGVYCAMIENEITPASGPMSKAVDGLIEAVRESVKQPNRGQQNYE